MIEVEPGLLTPLNILYVGTLPPHPGGTAIACARILSGLAQMGHAVRSIAPITPETVEHGDSFAISAPWLGVRRYTVPHFEVHPITGPASYRAFEGRQLQPLFADLVADEPPDVVIVGRPSFAWHVPNLAAANGLPCIAIIHGSPWVDLLRGTYGVGVAQEFLAEIGSVARVVTPARHLAEDLAGLGITAIPIPNPVDIERFRPGARNPELAHTLGIDEDDVVVAHASNLKPIKRPLDIVYSAERTLAVQPGIIYLIVGDGTSRAEMEAVCGTIGISSRFRFVGWVDNELIPDYLSLADIVVMPSDTEGQSLACLEAQATGSALLASNIPGAQEIVADGETGVLFERGDIGDLAAKTLLLASQPGVRRRIGARARCQALGHSVARVAGAYEAILQELVAEFDGSKPLSRLPVADVQPARGTVTTPLDETTPGFRTPRESSDGSRGSRRRRGGTPVT